MEARRRWIKINKDRSNLPPEFKGVYVWVNFEADEDGMPCGMPLCAHHEQKVWFTYDMFEKKKRPIRQQMAITDWKPLDKPNRIRKEKKE